MYRVLLRNNATQEERWHNDDGVWNEGGGDYRYLWVEGNNSCDCNRSRFFDCAEGRKIPISDFDRECGTGRYAVLEVELPDERRFLLNDERLENEELK